MFQLINYYYFICLFFVDKILIFYVLRKIIYWKFEIDHALKK